MFEVIKILLGFACIYFVSRIESTLDGIIVKLILFFLGIYFISGNEDFLMIAILFLLVGFVFAGIQKTWGDSSGDDGGGE